MKWVAETQCRYVDPDDLSDNARGEWVAAKGAAPTRRGAMRKMSRRASALMGHPVRIRCGTRWKARRGVLRWFRFGHSGEDAFDFDYITVGKKGTQA